VVSQPGKLPFDINTVIIYFIRLTGAHYNFDASFGLGLAALAALVIVFPYKHLRQYWHIVCILGFVLGTMVTTSVFRSCLTWAQFQASRYLIYPELLAATTCLFLITRIQVKKMKWIWMGGLLIIMLRVYGSNYIFGKMGFERTQLRAQTYPYWHPDNKSAAKIAKTACDDGIYCIEDNR
jgi:hypothetical protein